MIIIEMNTIRPRFDNKFPIKSIIDSKINSMIIVNIFSPPVIYK